MGLKINRENNLDKLFDKFAIDPTESSNNQPKEPDKKENKQKTKEK
ncbi:MAG TPA: hypothetical protein H9861_06405 [Candidatus Ligilactobacillus excrementigallinarum]|uniref:Uncharacterized protein n=1 Tax=Candidatus Ligilactobacillus excrementigallinarum TaxID=2838641 RepID=A0A9D1UXT0_9LACO|nr:hypothetical protein [Candidatus Ligilactobacillus excrementigallinarum]